MPTTDTNRIPVACFAPPLTDEKLAKYKELIEGCAPHTELRECLNTLYQAVVKWWNLPESKLTPKKWEFATSSGKSLTADEIKLEHEHIKELFELVPWMRELDTLSTANETGLFDQLKGELRNCAFDLLWHCKELTLDREPMTADKLK